MVGLQKEYRGSSVRIGFRKTTIAAVICVLAVVAYAAPGNAAEMRLHDVYSQSGQYNAAHLGAGNIINGEATLGSFSAPQGGVAKAYLYWLGSNQPYDDFSTDDTIIFNALPTNPLMASGISVPVTAATIDTVDFEKPFSPGNYYWNANHRSFVADVTDLIQPGATNYSISGFDMDTELGVGLQIIYEQDGGGDVTIYQGQDYAFRNWPGAGELNRTYVLNHTFAAENYDREITATFFVGGGSPTDRPDQLWAQTGSHQSPVDLPEELVIGNALSYVVNTNPLEGTDGDGWDTVTATILVPAGSTYASFQFESGGGTGAGRLPESFSWLSASITMVPEPSALVMLSLGAVALLRRKS